MRAFVAVELNDSLRAALAQTIQSMQNANPPLKLKWVAPQNQHLTLQFLGEVKLAAVNDIAQALQQAAVGIAPFELTLVEIGCFPNIYKPNILWVSVQEPSGALQKLYKAVGAHLARIGYPVSSSCDAGHSPRPHAERASQDIPQSGRGVPEQRRDATQGYPPDARAFAPHLTLARLPRAASAREKKLLGAWFSAQPSPAPQTMRVTQVHLMQSELLPAGARYTALRVVELAA